MRLWYITCSLFLSACAAQSAVSPGKATTFPDHLKQLRQDATAQGLPGQYITQVFGNHPKPFQQVVQAQANQPEDKDAFQKYLNRILSPTRIARGTEMLSTHNQALTQVSQTSGVPSSVIVALWGVETNYGGYTGDIPIIKALATLSYTDVKRPDFFRRELFEALRVAKQTGRNGHTLLGSWAGAVGQNQFMPSNWGKLGRDGDGDGRINLIESEADVFASTANYLTKAGWQAGQGWKFLLSGTRAPASLELNSRGLSKSQSYSQWKSHGLTWPKGLPTSAQVRYYQPMGPGTQAYALGPNFDVILDWNYSSFFAFSVLTLADTLQQKAS